MIPDTLITGTDADLANTIASEIHYIVVGFVDSVSGDKVSPIPFEAVDSNELNSNGNMEWSFRYGGKMGLRLKGG